MTWILDKNLTFAIVGASTNKDKFGYKVLMNLKGKGFKVVPVNPNCKKIENMVCYPDLASMKDRPDVAVIVTPPEASLKILQECARIKLRCIWFQPGASDEKVVKLAKEACGEVVSDRCIMTETN